MKRNGDGDGDDSVSEDIYELEMVGRLGEGIGINYPYVSDYSLLAGAKQNPYNEGLMMTYCETVISNHRFGAELYQHLADFMFPLDPPQLSIAEISVRRRHVLRMMQSAEDMMRVNEARILVMIKDVLL